jgi:hypothetical protein
MTRTSITVMRPETVRGHYEYELVVEGELVEHSSHEPPAWDFVALHNGQPWDGTLSSVESARAIFALCEAARQAKAEREIEVNT